MCSIDHSSTSRPQLHCPTTAQPPDHSSTSRPQLNRPTTALPPVHSSTARPQLYRPATAQPPDHSSTARPQLSHHSSAARPQLNRLTTAQPPVQSSIARPQIYRQSYRTPTDLSLIYSSTARPQIYPRPQLHRPSCPGSHSLCSDVFITFPSDVFVQSFPHLWTTCLHKQLSSVRTDGLHTKGGAPVHCKVFIYNFSYAQTVFVQKIVHLYIARSLGTIFRCTDGLCTNNCPPVDCKVLIHSFRTCGLSSYRIFSTRGLQSCNTQCSLRLN